MGSVLLTLNMLLVWSVLLVVPSVPVVRARVSEVHASKPVERASVPKVRASKTVVHASVPKVHASKPVVHASVPKVHASKPVVRASKPEVRAGLLSLLSSQSGEVLTPTHPGYEARRKVMNAACTARPAVIVVPNTERDVSTILQAAVAENMEVSVRSGGHSYTCTNIKEGGVHIDMRNFNKLEMVRTSQIDTGLALKLGPGLIWGDVLEFAPPTRYSFPHGQCRSVGVGGYLLGGGVNWLGSYNKYGYGAEHVLAMNVVLADGSIGNVDSRATSIEHPIPRWIPHAGNNDLFSGLRGAGSSMAVVTEFLYMIYET